MDALGNTTACSYDRAGNLTKIVECLNSAGQLKTLKDETKAGEVISDLAYEYDGRGNIVRINGMEAGAADAITGTEGEMAGAEEGVSLLPVSIAMTYDADNRLMTYNGQNVEYDAFGNMTKGPLDCGMAEFSYDCRNRLVKVMEEGGKTTVYEYGTEDIRTASVTGGVRTEYTTDREAEYSQTLVKTFMKRMSLAYTVRR